MCNYTIYSIICLFSGAQEFALQNDIFCNYVIFIFFNFQKTRQKLNIKLNIPFLDFFSIDGFYLHYPSVMNAIK